MKIDRRSFLALGIGAAAGTALSPLPWKMTDDSSIWTQNWPWTPVPVDGEISYQSTVCSLCPGGCGITVRKIDNRIVKIEGQEGHPLSDGNICPLGASGLQLLYGPGRVTSPMKQTGKRGSEKWEKISWDDALAEISEKLKKLDEAGQNDSLACISGSDRDIVSQLFNRFLMAYGSPNFTKTPSMEDSLRTVSRLMHGKNDNIEIGYDLENADFILSFGSGLTDGWGSPVHMCGTRADWKDKRAKIVQIEQRLSRTAAIADRVISINPGTEADFALGLATIIVNEELYSKKFTGAFSTGFPEFKIMLNKYYNTDSVADKTGFDRHLMIDLARLFAQKGSRSIAVCGKGRGETPGSLREFMAVHSLNALIGNINETGGVHAIESGSYIKWKHDVAVLEKIDGKPRIDEAGTANYPNVKYLLNRLPDKILAAKESPVKLLFVNRANPLYTMSDTAKVKKAFEKIPFIVSFSSYMDETAAFSDLILPDHNYLEKTEDIPVTAGLAKPYTGLSKPVISPLYDTMHTGDVIIRLAKLFGKKTSRFFKWGDYQNCLAVTMGDELSRLESEGFRMDDAYKPLPWNQAFGGTFRKFAFSGKKHPAPPFAGDPKKFPLVLLPKESMGVSSNSIPSPPFVIKNIPDSELLENLSVVEINPATADKFGLRNGDKATLSTPTGKAIVSVTRFDGIRPGVIAIAKGLGHTAFNIYLKDKGTNFNTLSGAVEDPATGLDVNSGIRATLTRA